MPRIRWTNLPPSLRQHLFDRVADRQIPAEDLYKLKLWRESEPEAPDGPWYKDFTACLRHPGRSKPRTMGTACGLRVGAACYKPADGEVSSTTWPLSW